MIESYTFRIENEQRRNVHFGMFVSSEWFKLGTALSNNMCNPVTRIKLLLFWKIRLEMYIILSYISGLRSFCVHILSSSFFTIQKS